jgi:hypothetical protein
VITIMGAVSQWEREAIGERTRDALRHKRGQGQRVGNIAFGSRLAQDGEHLEPEPVEQAALAEIRRLRTQGATLREIASGSEPSEVPDAAGHCVAAGVSGPVLKQRRASGVHLAHGTVGRGNSPSLPKFLNFPREGPSDFATALRGTGKRN